MGNRIVIWMQVSSHKPKRNRFIGRSLDRSGTKHTRGVPVEQQSQQNLWRNRRAPFGPVRLVDAAQIELSDGVDHKAGQMRRRQTVFDPDCLLQHCLVIDGFEFSCHKMLP